jgi:hypothetical protein
MLSEAKHLLFGPSRREKSRFLSLGMTGSRDFHLHWWAEGPCNTRNDSVKILAAREEDTF